MNGEVQSILDECDVELNTISIWIEKNKFDTFVRFLVRYAVIKACGSIERAFKLMLYTKLANNCSEETKIFLQKQILDSPVNPSTGKIQKFFEKINSNWNRIFFESVKETDKGNLNSLVNLRNDFAHGAAINSPISSVFEYYNSGKVILGFIDEILTGK